MEHSSSWEANSRSASQIHSLFVELEDSLPWLHETTSGSYPELDESIVHFHILFL
jgi:hypothetical protein